MRTAIIALAFGLICAIAGFFAGFRQAWEMGMMANSVPRGVVGIGNTRLLEDRKYSDLRAFLASDIDSSLIWWNEIDGSPLRPALNILSGSDVIPNYERYVRRVAEYRKANPSPLDDPKLLSRTLETVREKDPEFAADMTEGQTNKERVMRAMIEKYAP